MTKRLSKCLRIAALMIVFPMVLATLGTLLNLPVAIRTLGLVLKQRPRLENNFPATLFRQLPVVGQGRRVARP